MESDQSGRNPVHRVPFDSFCNPMVWILSLNKRQGKMVMYIYISKLKYVFSHLKYITACAVNLLSGLVKL